jgi:CBS domain containing-hemolysin-like protein
VAGEKIVCAHWQFEVTELEGRRIDKVRAVQIPQAPDPD